MNAQHVRRYQRWLEANGIQRIYMSADGKSFSVSMYAEGDPIYATGLSLAEAFEEASAAREHRHAERLAA